MNTIKLFPTLIYKDTIGDYNRDAVLERTQYYLEKYPEYKQGNLEGGAKGIHDSFGELHKDPVFKEIVAFINQSVDKYWKELDYTSEWTPGISQMWANQYPRGGYATIHNHAPMWLTGVFYLVNEDNMGDLFVANPNQALLDMQPLGDNTRYTNRNTPIKVRTNDLVIFPGWLGHGTYPNNTDTTRIVIPFEISFKGMDLYQRIQKEKS
jgi:uncharacterized protein (TIGR02466 family)